MSAFHIARLVLVFCTFPFIPLIPAFGQAGMTSWPKVAPMHKSYYFEDARKAEAKMTIVSAEGRPLYLMECHTAEFEGDPDFDYSGDFECKLKSLYSKERYSTLLTDNPKQSRDWESRGRFLVTELIGKCAEYPEYGKVRHFRLRGMQITLTLSDIVIEGGPDGQIRSGNRPVLRSFRFDVQVEPDASALSPIAEPVPYQEPPYVHPNDPRDMTKACDEIKK